MITPQRIWSQCVKELAQFRRDRLTVALAFLLPLLTLFIFGYAIRLEAKNIPLTVQDLDNTPLSRSYIERLYATNQLNLVERPINQSITETIDQGKAKVGIVIPPDFSRKLKDGESVAVQVIIDGTDVNNARVIRGSIESATQYFGRISGLRQGQIAPLIDVQTRIWFNPGRKESLYIVPGTCAVILWIYPSLLSSMAMVREKEQGTILQVYASSLSAIELILGKSFAYMIVGLLEGFFIIGVSAILFDLRFAGDPTPFLIGTPIYTLVAVMFGTMIGTRVSNQNAAVQAVATIGFLTAFLLSGFIYPLSNIPFPLSLISNIVPARYYIPIIRDAFVRGTGWTGVWWAVLMLILLGLFLFNAARRNLSRMQLPD
ncbi:ABC transporter permease [Leptolyngbya ohadii]|uniref:ABC transporter permease n=1 Tax=Leptolyngbya ohadii TaxID=1962290 RepID=UPI000B598641|nr:ABC transporter permease [Leptolyngbya ohadii]